MIDDIYSEMADASERSNMGPKTSNFLFPEKTARILLELSQTRIPFDTLAWG